MRLITHNMLKCNVRGVQKGYPLRIECEKLEIIPAEYNQGNILHQVLSIQRLSYTLHY